MTRAVAIAAVLRGLSRHRNDKLRWALFGWIRWRSPLAYYPRLRVGLPNSAKLQRASVIGILKVHLTGNLTAVGENYQLQRAGQRLVGLRLRLNVQFFDPNDPLHSFQP